MKDLENIVSQKRRLSLLPFIEDPVQEINFGAVLHEQEESELLAEQSDSV